MAPLLLRWDLEFRKTTAGFDFFEGSLGLIGWRALLRTSKRAEGKHGRKRRGRVSGTPAVPYTHPEDTTAGLRDVPQRLPLLKQTQTAEDITSP